MQNQHIGTWEFRNVMHHLHGSKGTKTVYAGSESAAKQKIREEASRDLFGTTMMQRYVDVTLEKPRRRR